MRFSRFIFINLFFGQDVQYNLETVFGRFNFLSELFLGLIATDK
jgi:hypothetical protein